MHLLTWDLENLRYCKYVIANDCGLQPEGSIFYVEISWPIVDAGLADEAKQWSEIMDGLVKKTFD